MKPDKQQILTECQQVIAARIERARQAITYAQESANQETKSSAGDKYETGRALAQLERDKASRQMAEALKLKKVLDQVKPGEKKGKIEFGSVVITDIGHFMLAAGLGQIEAGKMQVFVLSPVSPLGRRLLGHVAGDTVQFNDRAYHILQVY
jgi:transcription elongation GreA/GreB family factor